MKVPLEILYIISDYVTCDTLCKLAILDKNTNAIFNKNIQKKYIKERDLSYDLSNIKEIATIAKSRFPDKVTCHKKTLEDILSIITKIAYTTNDTRQATRHFFIGLWGNNSKTWKEIHSEKDYKRFLSLLEKNLPGSLIYVVENLTSWDYEFLF